MDDREITPPFNEAAKEDNEKEDDEDELKEPKLTLEMKGEIGDSVRRGIDEAKWEALWQKYRGKAEEQFKETTQESELTTSEKERTTLENHSTSDSEHNRIFEKYTKDKSDNSSDLEL